MRIKYILAAALLVRFLFLFISNDEFNLWTFTAFTDLALKGYNPWLASFHLGLRAATESTPLMMLLMIGVVLSEKIFFLPSYIGFKMIMVFADILSAYFFYKIALMLSKEKVSAERVTLLFSLNPLMIFVSSITIIDDSIVILLTILALYFFLRYSNSESQSPEILMLSAFFLGLGISIKFYPLFLAPAFLMKLRKLKEMLTFLFLSILPFLVFSFPFVLWNSTSYFLSFLRYAAVPPTIVKLVGTDIRQPVAGFSLWWVILDLMETETPELVWLLNQMAFVSIGIAFVIISYFMRKKNPTIVINLNLAMLMVYLLYFRMSAHYIAWILPFAYLLTVNSSKNRPNIRSFPLVISILVLVFYMLVAGQYGSTGGRQLYTQGAGIFHFFYPILKSGLLTWAILGLDWLSIIRMTTFLVLAINIYFLAKLLCLVRKESNKRILSFWRIKKFLTIFHKRLVIVSLLLVTLSLMINPNVYATSNSGNASSVFFDTFGSEYLSFDWYWTGEGTYSMHPQDTPSYILLDTKGVEKRSFIYQYLYYLIPPQVYGNHGTIEFRFQTEELAQNATTLLLFSLDHGWLSAEKVFRETSPKVLFDRYLQYSWAPVAFGLGGLGVPTLEYDLYDVEKMAAMRVDISNGTFLQSGVVRSFDISQDWTEYNYLFLEMYGNKTGTTTWLSIQSPDAANARTYSFVDTWEGWKTIVFALKRSQPTDTGNPDISKVKKIFILWQSAGHQYINRIGIEKDLNYSLRYNYFDTMASKRYLLRECDFMSETFSWHTFKITCNNTGRYVYFDSVPKLSRETSEEKTFSYVLLGNFDQKANTGGSIKIDWVNITIDSLKQDYIELSLAFGLPSTTVISIGVVLYLRTKRSKKQARSASYARPKINLNSVFHSGLSQL